MFGLAQAVLEDLELFGGPPNRSKTPILDDLYVFFFLWRFYGVLWVKRHLKLRFMMVSGLILEFCSTCWRLDFCSSCSASWTLIFISESLVKSAAWNSNCLGAIKKIHLKRSKHMTSTAFYIHNMKPYIEIYIEVSYISIYVEVSYITIYTHNIYIIYLDSDI